MYHITTSSQENETKLILIFFELIHSITMYNVKHYNIIKMSNRRCKMFMLFLFLLTGIQFSADAQKLSFQQLEDSVQSLMDEQHLPALLVSIQCADSTLWKTTLGTANLAEQEAASSHHLFKIGSISKTFTALAIMQLIKEGKFNLDTEVSQLAPNLPIKNPWQAERPVLVKDLLEHKAGFDDMHLAAFSQERTADFTALDEVMVFKKSLSCRWRPGLIHSYANPGYVVLAYIIEQISGIPYQQYIHEQVLAPLGMDETFYISELERHKSLTTQGYFWDGKDFQLAKNVKLVGEGAGAMMSNAIDMAKFAQYFLNDSIQNQLSLLDAESVAEMEQVHGDLEIMNGISEGYGLGLYHRSFGTHKLSFYGHNGGINGYSSDFIYSEALDLSIVLSNNGEGSNRKIMNLLVDFYADADATEKVKDYTKTHELSYFEKWEGSYRVLDSRNALYDFINYPFRTAKLAIKGDSLYITRFMGEPEAYYYLGGSAFAASDEQSASVFLGEVDGAVYLNYNDSLLAPVNGLLFLLLRLLLMLALVAALLSSLGFLYQLVLWPFKKVKPFNVFLSFLITSVFLAFLLSVKELLSNNSMEALAEMGTVGYSSLFIFISTSLMPILFLLAFYFLYKNWKSFATKWSKFYYSFLLSGAFILFLYCAFSGWIFVQLWNY